MSQSFQRLCQVLLWLSGCIALAFSYLAAKQIYFYSQLDETSVVTKIDWNVKRLPSSRYALEGTYTYVICSHEYQGICLLKSPLFLNRFAAENQKKEWKLKSWRVWFSKKNYNISSLEKEFPSKALLHALLTFGVFAYFYFMKELVQKLDLKKR